MGLQWAAVKSGAAANTNLLFTRPERGLGWQWAAVRDTPANALTDESGQALTTEDAAILTTEQ